MYILSGYTVAIYYDYYIDSHSISPYVICLNRLYSFMRWLFFFCFFIPSSSFNLLSLSVVSLLEPYVNRTRRRMRVDWWICILLNETRNVNHTVWAIYYGISSIVVCRITYMPYYVEKFNVTTSRRKERKKWYEIHMIFFPFSLIPNTKSVFPENNKKKLWRNANDRTNRIKR